MTSSCQGESVPMQTWTDSSRVLTWIECHSGLTSLIALIFAVLSALFKPSTWRRVVSSFLAGFVGFLFLPYDADNVGHWIFKALILAVVFIFAFWWILGRYQAWRIAGSPLLAQPSGTFETIVDTVRRFPAGSNVSVRMSSTQGTLTITKTTVDTNKKGT